MSRFPKRFSRSDNRSVLPVRSLAILLLWLAGCKGLFERAPEYMYVVAPQATLRDSTATVFSKLVTLQNGERVQVLGHDRGFVKVRSGEALEGWVERRFLVGQDVYDSFAQLAAFHARDPIQSHGSARLDVNMHITPSRDAEKLYQLKQRDAIELLARVSTPREEAAPSRTTTAKPTALPETQTAAETDGISASAPEQPAAQVISSQESSTQGVSAQTQPPPSLEDWWLVRDVRGHVGWIVGRLIAVNLPIAIADAGFAQGQRPVASMVLTTVMDPSINGPDKRVPYYLILFTENKDGLPYDYDQVRVFTWNMRRSLHRYEQAYHEHLLGALPAKVGKEDFIGEGAFPVFTLRVKTDSGEEERMYKVDGTSVKRVLPSEVRATAKPWEHQLSRGSGRDY